MSQNDESLEAAEHVERLYLTRAEISAILKIDRHLSDLQSEFRAFKEEFDTIMWKGTSSRPAIVPTVDSFARELQGVKAWLRYIFYAASLGFISTVAVLVVERLGKVHP